MAKTSKKPEPVAEEAVKAETTVAEAEIKPETVNPEPPKEAAKGSRSEAGQAEPERLMYVGPTIPGIGTQNRVYTQIPPEAIEAAQRSPELNNLFIPIQNYPTACRMLREQNGYIFNAFQKALSLRGGNSHE